MMVSFKSTFLVQANSVLILIVALAPTVDAFAPSITSGNICRLGIRSSSSTTLVPAQSLSSPINSNAQGRRHASHGSASSSTTSLAFTLTTALESLAEERCSKNDGEATNGSIKNAYYKHIKWIDPKADPSLDDVADEDGTSSSSRVVPLYPLSELHLPATGTNHTLINTEPRNVQMALDLIQKNKDNEDEDMIFCVVLYAIDTGNIASIGTLLRIVDYEIQYDYEDKSKIRRIQLTCESVIDDPSDSKDEDDHNHNRGLVDVLSIENPNAASTIQRLKRSSEYLRAKVTPIISSRRDVVTDSQEQDEDEEEDHSAMIDQIIQDWNLKKTMYTLGIGNRMIVNDKGDNEVVLLPDTLPNIADGMSTWDTSTFYCSAATNIPCSPTLFWNAVQQYQSVCYTVRDSMQRLLSSERNEKMVQVAMVQAREKGEILSLPIHMEDLPPSTRKELDTMNVQTQNLFVERQLDPTLDMLALVSLPTHNQRIRYFAHLISRERLYLETMAKQYTSSTATSSMMSSNDNGIIDEDLDFSIFGDEDNKNGSGGDKKDLSLMDIYRNSVSQSIKNRRKQEEKKKEKGAWFEDDMWQ